MPFTSHKASAKLKYHSIDLMRLVRSLTERSILMKKFISLILASALGISLAACGTSSDSSEQPGASTALSQDFGTSSSESSSTETAEESLHEDSLPEYERCDEENFLSLCDELTAAGEEGNAEKVIELYEQIYGEYQKIYTNYDIATIRSYQDTTSEYWDEEAMIDLEMLNNCFDAYLLALKSAGEGACADALEEYFGADNFAEILSYEAMTDEQLEMTKKEKELTDEYIELATTEIYDVSYTYDGVVYTTENLDDAYYNTNDYDAYLEVYNGLLKQINDLLGAVYLELVQLRVKIADSYGYDNYSDYAYECIYSRDYTPEDAQNYCDIIRENVAVYYNLEYSGLEEEIEAEEETVTAALENLAVIFGKMDEDISAAFTHFLESGYYDISTSENMAEQGFTTELPSLNDAYIFYNTALGDTLLSISHEFGHYYNAYKSASDEPLLEAVIYADDMDICEIQSNGLEALATNYYNLIYQDGDSRTAIVLNDLMNQVVNGCIQDEFQRAVYNDPDMSLDEMNELYCRICKSYGEYETGNVDYSWVFYPHTYQQPLYYFSYSISCLEALDIWYISQDDLQKGIDTYLSVVEYDDDYRGGVLDMADELGLLSMTDEEGITELGKKALNSLLELTGYTADELSKEELETYYIEYYGYSPFDYAE